MPECPGEGMDRRGPATPGGLNGRGAAGIGDQPHDGVPVRGETGSAQTAGPSATAVTAEGDSSEDLPASEAASSHLSEPSTSADTHTSVGPLPHLVGLAYGESPLTCEHKQTLVAGAAVESSRRWGHSSPGSAQLDPDAEPWGPAMKRRVIEGQQHIAEVLEQLPRALPTIVQRMEESNSCMSGILSQGRVGISEIVSRVGAGMSAIELQARLNNESIQALTTAARIQGEQRSATLNRLIDTLQLAFQGFTQVLQPVVQQGGRSDVGLGQETDDGERGHGSGDATQSTSTSYPLPPSQPVPAMLPPLQVAEPAPAQVQVEQSLKGPSQVPKLRGRPHKASHRSGHGQEQPATSSAEATGVAPHRGYCKCKAKVL
ncbi:uncharacterized protein [Heptranchias perlo]|uniref:uncharacterized protein isoform X1 n=1 Tax=Heptranchias perlo TaxID=212740 RepID=UPI00355AB310